MSEKDAGEAVQTVELDRDRVGLMVHHLDRMLERGAGAAVDRDHIRTHHRWLQEALADADDVARLVCRGSHLGSGQFSHDPAEFVEAALGDGETGLRCPECGTVVERDADE